MTRICLTVVFHRQDSAVGGGVLFSNLVQPVRLRAHLGGLAVGAPGCKPSSEFGTIRPSALAVLRLTGSLNLVGVCTGRSPAFPADQVRAGEINLKTAKGLVPASDFCLANGGSYCA